jgi:putative ATP-dependent endonuclease of the OLD family
MQKKKAKLSMKLRKLKIQNFRGIKDLELDLDDTTVLIGENNSGKTAVLDVLRLCLRDLGPRRSIVFDVFDFHLKDAAAEPSSADPIQITITFSEDAVGDWNDQLVGRLNRHKVLQVDGDSRSHVVLRVTCAYDPNSRDFEQDWKFLNLGGQPLTGVSETALGFLQSEVSYFYLAALRDAARHFDAKGPFWRPFLKDSQLSAEKRAEIEQKLQELNDLVVASHTSFEQARLRLSAVQNVVPMSSGDVVSIEAVPGRMFDMLAKAQIHLGAPTGAKVPVGRHGEGTQSLAVLMLFSAFLDAWPKGSPIIALEEPEAHLHPSAVRALWGVVNGIGGQKLISTHSGDLLSEIPAGVLRRLARTPTGTQVYRLKQGTLSLAEERKFNFHIRFVRGELLFARCWLLVEGETEITLLPEIARHLNINLEQAGVRCVPHRHAGIELFLKVARDLGISWCVLADNDMQGARDQSQALNYAGTGNLADLLHVIPEDDIEQHLCAQGFGSVYQAIYEAHPQLRQARATVPPCPQCGRGQQPSPSITVSQGDPKYWPQLLKVIRNVMVKPAAALEVANLIHAGTLPVPPLLETAIRSAVALAGGS